MSSLQIIPDGSLGYGFVPPEFLSGRRDEYTLRDLQVGKPAEHWRALTADELEELVKNSNTADDWDDVRVAEGFNPQQVRGCQFSGWVRLGRIDEVNLVKNDLAVPAGLWNSHVISCDIGDNAAIRNVRYLSRYIVGDNAILLNVDEIQATNHAKFGNGIVKDGEDEEVRIWLDLINETGGRSVLPFDGLIPADAYIWARYRHDEKLLDRLRRMTEAQFDSRRGWYGTIGAGSVIKHCRIIKDVKIGAYAYIKGANKLKNLTINSTGAEPTQIGEGVEMVNGIIGLGCHVFYGCKAVRFVMGNNTSLKYGARLIHSVLGDNSTVSCCEMLHNLIFPAHEQHHNNSFLTAALVKGQSNLAAGATVGSNHNSRANDGEVEAGRGFWPGLCTTLKHSSRFASFVLLAKGDYPAELDIRLPFALVSDDPAHDRLLVMPAFWWLHNMYALARNTWKFQTRDKRRTRTQNIEFDSLAPDTAEEMFAAMRLLEIWTAKADLRRDGEDPDDRDVDELAARGRKLLSGDPQRTAELEVLGEGQECSHRKSVILKPREGWRAYREMLHYYAMKTLLEHVEGPPKVKLAAMRRKLAGPRETEWENLGGQLIPGGELKKLLSRIRNGRLKRWDEVHAAYDELWEAYPLARQRHAFATLLDVLGVKSLTPKRWRNALDEAGRIQEYICRQVYQSRAKDFENPFRQATFQCREEMEAVVGAIEDNSFVNQTRRDTKGFLKRLAAAKKRG